MGGGIGGNPGGTGGDPGKDKRNHFAVIDFSTLGEEKLLSSVKFSQFLLILSDSINSHPPPSQTLFELKQAVQPGAVQLQIAHKPLQIHKYKYTNIKTNTQMQIHKEKYDTA